MMHAQRNARGVVALGAQRPPVAVRMCSLDEPWRAWPRAGEPARRARLRLDPEHVRDVAAHPLIVLALARARDYIREMGDAVPVMKRRLFTVRTADLREERYRGSGAGGQNRNKRDTGVRFTHEPSGAVGESEAQRTQLQNRQEAFRKMAESPRFQSWARAQAAAIVEGFASLDRKVNDLMDEKHLRFEVTGECVPGEAVCLKGGE